MRLLFSFLLAMLAVTGMAQLKPTDLDKSPMDVSYCPNNYPVLKMNGKTGEQPVARILYSRPQRSGRKIFGEIVPYNQIWRMGANECTEIEFFRNVKIRGKVLPKGRYSMYAICGESKWAIAFNSEKDCWGMVQNPKKDVLRAEATVQRTTEPVEALTMYFEDVKGGTNLIVMWDDMKATLPITF